MTNKQLFALKNPFEEVFIWLALNDQEVLNDTKDETAEERKEREDKEKRGEGGNR